MWRKDQKVLRNSKKYSISKKGALRIQDVGYSDSGMYTCLGARLELKCARVLIALYLQLGAHLPTSQLASSLDPATFPRPRKSTEMRPRAEAGSSEAPPDKRPTSWTPMTLAPDTTRAQTPVMVKTDAISLKWPKLSFFPQRYK
jgi:Immunoglobulin I-set domain